MEELSKNLDSVMVELNKVYTEKYPNWGRLDKRIIDVHFGNATQKIQILVIGEKSGVEPDVIFTLEKTNEHIIVEIPFLARREKFSYDEKFYEVFYNTSLEILSLKSFENRLNHLFRHN